MLKIENLHFEIHGVEILKGIHLEFQEGLLHAIIGPNGAGKSSLLKNICRIWKPACGKIFLDDWDVLKMPRQELSQKMSFVPQDTVLAFPMPVKEMVLMGRNPHIPRFHSLRPEDFHIAQEAMEEVGIAHLSQRSMQELSCGERQRVWIACALTTQSPWILLDEPTSSLDIHHKLKIFSLLKKFQEKGRTILVSIHELQYAYLYFDTVTILNEGKVYSSGKTKEIITQKAMKEVFHVNTSFIKNSDNTFLHFSFP